MNELVPLVSMIMPSYNQEKYIEDAMQSVWNQTYSNVKLIVLDDGSKDNFPKIIKELEQIDNLLFLILQNIILCFSVIYAILNMKGRSSVRKKL